jgi:hypothetical protein
VKEQTMKMAMNVVQMKAGTGSLAKPAPGSIISARPSKGGRRAINAELRSREHSP